MCLADDGSEIFNTSRVVEEECGPLSMGRWMSQVGNKMIYQNGSVDMATWDQDGNRPEDEKVRYPFEIKFIPNRDVLTPTNGDSRIHTQLSQNSLNIATDALLFTVEARPVLSDGTFGDFEKIGDILQGADSWVESLWGDERLFFAHQPIVYDIRDHRLNLERSDIRQFNKTVREELDQFNHEKYGDWDKEFVPEETEETDIIDGMVNTGCPFAFVIDQINGFL